LDVAQRTELVEAELSRLIEKRSRNGEATRDDKDELWKASIGAYNERLRRQRVAAWFAHFCRMADNHAQISERYRERAEELCEHEDDSET
jgi:hypothetical protein